MPNGGMPVFTLIATHTVPENILLQKSTASAKCEIFLPPLYRLFYGVSGMRRHLLATVMQFSECSIFISKILKFLDVYIKTT